MKINFRILFILSSIMLIIIISDNALSLEIIPTPHGIDGVIYTEDNVTEVKTGTFVSVRNADSGFYTEGLTGIEGSSGKYSFSIEGDNGDIIIIKAWNDFHITNRTIILQGSMHNVNLLLNTVKESAIRKLFEGKKEISSDGFQDDKIIARKIKESISISGIIRGKDISDLSRNSVVTITNLENNKSIDFSLNESPLFGSFSAVLEGKSNDAVEIRLRDEEIRTNAVVIDKSPDALEIELDRATKTISIKERTTKENDSAGSKVRDALFYSVIAVCMIALLLLIIINRKKGKPE